MPDQDEQKARKPKPSPSRFLAPQAKAGNGFGYLTRPLRSLPEHSDPDQIAREAARVAEAVNLCDEPEAAGDAWVDAQAELAARRDLQRRIADHAQMQHDRRRLKVESRMLDADRRARLQRIDVRREMFLLAGMLSHGRRAAALERLERLERRLDGVPDDQAA